jgi:3-isopropylmalate dehydratase small subunit
VFEINPEIRERLLAGQDEIGLSLEHEPEIDHFERERQEIGTLTTKI